MLSLFRVSAVEHTHTHTCTHAHTHERRHGSPYLFVNGSPTQTTPHTSILTIPSLIYTQNRQQRLETDTAVKNGKHEKSILLENEIWE